MQRLGFAVLSGLVALSVGCSQSGSSASVHAPDALDPALGAVCDLIMRCPDELPPLASHNRSECIDIVYWALTCRLSSTGVMRTELPLDSAQAQACGAALGALSCEQYRTCTHDGTCPDITACMSLFTGLGQSSSSSGDVAARGERCYRYGTPGCGDADYCAPEAYDAEHGVMLCEVCAPRLAAGATCDSSAPRPECAATLACVYDSTTSTSTCQTPRAAGQACSGNDSECATGLFCANNVCTSGGHAGDPCTENYACRYREQVTCISGTCAALHGPGEACAEAADCTGNSCHTDGLCGLPDGERCSGSAECRTGYCPSFTACTPRVANGTACTYDDMCTSQHCDTASSTCAAAPPPQPIGGPCTSVSDCETGLECNTTCYRPCGDTCPTGNVCIYTGSRSECLPPRPTGASCEGDEDCMSGYCNQDSNVCAVRPAIGDPCSGVGECYPLGYCTGGVCVARLGPDQACSGYDSCLDPFVCLNGHCSLISLSCEPAPVGQQCTFLRFCAADAYCDVSSFTCAARHTQGQECSRVAFGGDDCAPGLTCASGTSGSTCQPRVALGGACMPTDICVEGAFCVSGHCTMSGGGNDCNQDSDCVTGTYCDQHSDTCEPFRQTGDVCDPFNTYRDRCDASLNCDQDSRVCTVRPGVGGTCDRDTLCGTGATCSSTSGGTCMARVHAGDMCSTSFDDPWGSNCDETLYCDTSVSPNVCTARHALGATCSDDDECITNICASNRCLVREECVPPAAM